MGLDGSITHRALGVVTARSLPTEFPQVPAFRADAVMVDCGHCFGTLREWRNAQRLNARADRPQRRANYVKPLQRSRRNLSNMELEMRRRGI
jgi:hypothetical protein